MVIRTTNKKNQAKQYTKQKSKFIKWNLNKSQNILHFDTTNNEKSKCNKEGVKPIILYLSDPIYAPGS